MADQYWSDNYDPFPYGPGLGNTGLPPPEFINPYVGPPGAPPFVDPGVTGNPVPPPSGSDAGATTPPPVVVAPDVPSSSSSSPPGGFGPFTGIGAIFGRRVYKPGALEKAIERGLKTGLESIFRGIANRFPRDLPKMPPTSPPPPNFPVVRDASFPPMAAASGGFGLGAIIGVVVGVMIPRGLFPQKIPDTVFPPPGPHTPEELAPYAGTVADAVRLQKARERQIWEDRNRDLAGTRELQRVLEGAVVPPGNRITLPPQNYGRPVEGPSVGEAILRGIEDGETIPQILKDAVNASKRGERPAPAPQNPGAARVDPQAPGGVSVPGTGLQGIGPPAPNSSTKTPVFGGRPGAGRIGAAGIAGLIGLSALFAVHLRHSRSRGSTSSAPIASPIVPITPPSQNTTPVNNPAVGSFAVSGFYGGAGGGGYCEPRPRGPRRKCLERAPVSWRSGSRKGKSAGTKCLRYASRRI